MGESEFGTSFQSGTEFQGGTTGTQSDFNKELSDLKSDLANLKKDMGELLSSLMSVGKSGASSAYGRASDEVSRQISKLGGVYGSARDQGSKAFESLKSGTGAATESIQQTIEERPMTSVIVALGVGIILGRVLSGSWK
jgi:ElaB/YqjD/DUF883 family membrane-anchored ribosome-binding protein